MLFRVLCQFAFGRGVPPGRGLATATGCTAVGFLVATGLGTGAAEAGGGGKSKVAGRCV